MSGIRAYVHIPTPVGLVPKLVTLTSCCWAANAAPVAASTWRNVESVESMVGCRVWSHKGLHVPLAQGGTEYSTEVLEQYRA